MVVGKIISIFDISIEVVLESNDIKVGDILEVEGNSNYRFEVVEINNTSAICISLESTRGLRKGASVTLVSNGIHVEYSDNVLGRIFNSYGDPIDKKEINSLNKRRVDHDTTSLKELNIESQILWTGIKVIDFFAPLQKGFKMGLLGGAGVGIASYVKNKRLREAKELIYKNAIAKQTAILKALKEERDADKERIDYLNGLNILLQSAINDLKHDLGIA